MLLSFLIFGLVLSLPSNRQPEAPRSNQKERVLMSLGIICEVIAACVPRPKEECREGRMEGEAGGGVLLPKGGVCERHLSEAHFCNGQSLTASLKYV